jgi:hypothetical protein
MSIRRRGFFLAVQSLFALHRGEEGNDIPDIDPAVAVEVQRAAG